MSYIGITQQLNLIRNAYANLDSKYGPYESIQDALDAIPIVLRKEGLTIGVIENGTIRELWFKTGIEDSDLVEKGDFDMTPILQALAEKVDKEVGSALMTQAERDMLQALANEGINSEDLNALKGMFLSKVLEDVAKEKIIFEKGIDVSGLTKVQDTEFGEFSSGIHLGKGGRITKEGEAELESLIVRSFLEVPELRYNRLTLIGEEFAVGAGGIIESVEPYGAGHRITLKLEEGEMNPFYHDDIIKGIYHHDNGFRTTWFRVVSPTSPTRKTIDIVMRPGSGNNTYPVPVPFMHIARWGNFNSNPNLIDNRNRQSVLVLSAKTGSITFHDGINNYGNGYINSQWGKPAGLEFIHNFENLPIGQHDPVLYLRTLLVQDIFRVNHEGYQVTEYRDRGIWDLNIALGIATGNTPYESSIALMDEVWHNKVKYRCIQDKTIQEPAPDSPYWLTLFALEDGTPGKDGESALVATISKPFVVLKADENENITSYQESISEIKVIEGIDNLTPILSSDPQVASTFWLENSSGTRITPGVATPNIASKTLDISVASNMTTESSKITWTVKGKRANGADFTVNLEQIFIKVNDGKGLQISLLGAKNTLAEIQAVVNPNRGDSYINREDGNVYVWDGSTWNDSGQFTGNPGEGAWVHFAYADVILRDSQGQYAPPLDDEGGENFTLSDYADKRWLGVYWDNNPKDSLISRDYKWTRVKGPKGDPGENGTSVSIKGRVADPSALPSSATLGNGYISEDTGSLWIYDGTTQDKYLDANQILQDAVFGWLNVGQIKGESSYIHIAWADDVIFDATNKFQAVVGFTTLNVNKKRWYGVYVDDKVNDADEEDANLYAWTDTKGEAGKDSHSDEFIFIANNDDSFGVEANIPPNSQVIDYVPPGWSDDPVGVSSTVKYEWVSKRKFRDEVWGPFSVPAIWNIFVKDGNPGAPGLPGEDGEDGVDGKDSKSDEFIFRRNNNPGYGIASNRPSTSQTDDFVPTNWTDDPTGVTEENQYEWVCKRIFRNGVWSAFSIPALWARWSKDGKSPYVGSNGNWFVWSHLQDEYIDSGDPSHGDNGNSPRIHSTGFWEVWGDTGGGVMGWILTEVRARGIDGVDSKAQEFIFIRNNNASFTTIPPTSQEDDYVPTGWTDDPMGATSLLKYEWVSTREYRDGTWKDFSKPSIWNIFVEDGEDGEDGKDSKAAEFIFKRNNVSNYNNSSNRPPSLQQDDYVPTGWTDDPTGVIESQAYEWVCKRIFQTTTQTWSEFSIPALWAKFSKDGKTPYIADNGNWMIWDYNQDKFIDSGDPSQGDNGNSPRINDSGYWEVWGDTGNGVMGWIPTGVKARGTDGKDSKSDEFIFIRNNDNNFGIASNTPTSIQQDDYVPTNWTDDPVGVSSTLRYEWVSTRKFRNNSWGAFSTPSIWNMYIEDGVDGKDSKAAEFIFKVNNDFAFNKASNRPYSNPSNDDYQPTGWTDDPTGPTSQNRYEWVCKRMFKIDTQTWSEFSIPALWANFSEDGDSGVSISSVTEYYLASSLDTGITINSPGWRTSLQTLTPTNKYLWNYEKINFSNSLNQSTSPVIIGVYGDTGRSIVSIEERYLTSSSNTGITRTSPGWSASMKITTSTNKYLWNYEIINWNKEPLKTYTEPVIIGVHGDKGEAGKDSKAEEFIFTRNNNPDFNTIPNNSQEDDFVPTDWTDDPLGVTPSLKYEWVSVRKYRNDIWEDFSIPSIWNIYVTDGTDGEDGKDSKSDEFIFFRTNNPNFGIADNRPNSEQLDDFVPDTPQGWSDDPLGVTPSLKYEFVSKRIFRNNTWSNFSIPSLWAKYAEDGAPGEPGGNVVPYMAGEWQGKLTSGQWLSTREYKRDQYSYPVVSWLKDSQEKPIYYFLKKEVTLGVGSPSPQKDYSSNLGNWQLAEGYELVIMEAIFSNFAKLGSFIFNGDSMFSQEGLIGVTPSTDFKNSYFKPNFKVNGRTGKLEARNVSIQGDILASSGAIGGFLIEDGELSSTDQEGRIYMNGSTGKFKAKDAEISGNITARSLITDPNFLGRTTLNENLDRQLKFRYNNGMVAAKFGLHQEETELVPAMIWYDENGNEIWRAGKSGIKYVTNVTEDWRPVKMFRVATLGTKATLTSADNTDIANGLSSIKCSIDGTSSGQYGLNANVTYYNYTPGVNPQAEDNEQYRGLHTTQVKSNSNWIPSGWYVNPGYLIQTSDSNPTAWGFTLYRYHFGKLVDEYFAEDVDLGTVTTQCPTGLGL